MKKLFTLALALLFALSLAACDDEPEEVELPDMSGYGRMQIFDRMEELGFDEADINVMDHPDITSHRPTFHEYRDYQPGDTVMTDESIVIYISVVEEDEEEVEPAPRTPLDPDGEFTDYEDVALYLDTFDELPANYITLEEAMDEGYDPETDDLWDYADGKILGGDPFEEDPDDFDALPNGDERSYYIADVGYEGGDRGEERLVYSDDGLIFYSPDELDSFEQLFGTPEHPPLDPDGSYITKEEVGLYIRTFGELPDNYYVRSEMVEEYGTLAAFRRAKGDDAHYGYWNFSNFADQLPSDGELHWYIADIGLGPGAQTRRNQRLVFSEDQGLVYYTPDHYDSYEMLFGDGRQYD